LDASLYRHSQASKPALRIGLLLDTPVLPRCFAEVVDHIIQSDFASLELLVFNADAQPQARQPRPARGTARKAIDALTDRERREHLLYALYQRWDRRNVTPSDDPLAPTDCTERFGQVEPFSVQPITKRFVHRFPPDAIERIRGKQLDVLIRFGFNILRGEILTASRYGVWSYHHGDNDYYRGGPAYFWEMVEGNPISGAILQVLTEQLDAGRVLYRGHFATYPGMSHARNRVQPYWGASTFMIHKLRELHERGWEHVEKNAVPPAPYLGKKKIYVAPKNVDMLRWLAPLMIRKAWRRLVRRPVIQHWRLAIREGAPALATSGTTPDLNGFRWIEAPKGRFYADPFLIQADGKPWAFFEDYDYSTERGRISCAEVRDGGLSAPVTALERPYHLSYPCVFRDDDTWYMIPETVSAGTVELYRCQQFPAAWQFEQELFKGRAVDTTVWIEDDLYWFFVTLQEPRGYALQLWLFYATSLHGTWTPHGANPISTDARNARGAGAIFRQQDRLFRPSQESDAEYGRSFTLNEIVVLNRQNYREEPRVTVGPVWTKGLTGTHTYSRCGDIEIIDGKAPVSATEVL
jgi:hypothetical protein